MTDAPLADLGRRFLFNQNVLDMAGGGLTPEQWAATPPGGGNNAHWILGHIATTRRSLRRKLGEDLPKEAWEEAFGYGAQPAGTEGYPSVEALREDFATSGEKLGSQLAELDAAAVAQPWGSTFPDGSDTLGGGVGFLYFHECYHLGQVGLLRRMNGLEGFV